MALLVDSSKCPINDNDSHQEALLWKTQSQLTPYFDVTMRRPTLKAANKKHRNQAAGSCVG